MSGFAIGLGVTAAPQVTEAAGLAIAATHAPAIRPVRAGDRLSDTLDPAATGTGNYISSAGAIVSVLAEWSVDGGAWTADGTRILQEGEGIHARVTATDEAGNSRVFSAGTTSVAGYVPEVAASIPEVAVTLAVAGRTVTATASASGMPEPVLAIAMTENGAAVMPQGSGPEWSHEVPSRATACTVSVSVTATNSEGQAEAGASIELEGDLAAPAVTASAALSGRTLDIVVDSLSGAPAPMPALSALTLGGVDVRAAAVGTGPWAYAVPDSAAPATVAWEVTATNALGSDRASGSLSVPANLSAPVNTAAPVVSGGSGLGDVLTATAGTWTGTPAPTVSRQWQRNGANIPNATGLTYIIGLADSGAALGCRETATNPAGTASAMSQAITAQTFSAPVNTALPEITGTPELGATLGCSSGIWTGTPAPTLAYQWRRDGTAIGGATGNSTILAPADIGKVVDCVVTATNALGSASAAGPGMTIPETAVAPANVSAPLLAGGAHVGGTLAVTGGTWSGLPAPVLSYRWHRDGTDIPGATGDSHVVQPEDAGRKLACTLTATNSAGTASATTPEVEIEQVALGTTASGQVELTYNRNGTLTLTVTGSSVAAYNGDHVFTVADLDKGPVVLVPPGIAGAGSVGETLSLVHGALVVYTGTLGRSCRWLRDGAAIPGATDPGGYVVQAADAGAALSLAEDLADDNATAGPVTTESAAVTIPPGGSVLPVHAGFGTVATASGDRSATVAALPIGEAAADRVVFAAIHLEHAGAATAIAGVSIGGVPATLAGANGQNAENVNQFTHTAIFHARVPTGSTADVTVTLAAGDTGFRQTLAVATYAGTGNLRVHAAAARVAAGTSVGLDLATVAGGSVIAACTHRINGDIAPPAGMTKHYERAVNYYDAAGASMATTATETRSVTFTSTASNFFGGAAVSIEEIS